MAWKDPAHMLAGCAAAAKSPNTPAHLKPHLAQRTTTMGKISINPAHKGLFTAKAKAAGKSVQQYANEKAGAGGTLGKEANFARMAKRGFKPLAGKKKKKAASSPENDAFMGY